MNYKKFYNTLYNRKGAYFHEWIRLKNRTYFDHVSRILKFIGNGRVFDMGCGDCYITHKISGKSDIIGSDISISAISIGKRLYPKLKLINSSAIDVPIKSNTFNFVVCSKIIEHLTPNDADKMLCEAKRILKPKGKLILSTSNPLNIWEKILHVYLKFKSEEEEHIKEYSPHELENAITKYFSVETFMQIQDPPFFRHFPKISLFMRYCHKLFLLIFPFMGKYFINQLYVVARKQ